MHVPRHLSATEQARLAAEAAEEEERTRANASNDMAARALKQMMNGSLVAGQGGSAEPALARPPWMEGDPTLFTPEQQQEVRPLAVMHINHIMQSHHAITPCNHIVNSHCAITLCTLVTALGHKLHVL